MNEHTKSLWDKQAEQWSRIRPPLRPAGQDLIWAQESIDGWAPDAGPAPLALTLGMTPELVELRWPRGCTVVSVERSMPMITSLRVPSTPGRACGHVRADWAEMPIAPGSFGLVLGDGSLNSVPRARVEEVLCAVDRSLDDEGRLSVRAYIGPNEREQPDELWDRLCAHGFPNFGIFKFHLLMALADTEGNTRVAEAWDYFCSRATSPSDLAAHLDWPVAEVETIRAYRGQPDAYWFPTLDEFRAVVGVRFDELTCRWPDYEMGDRCPTFLLRRRPASR